MTTRVKILTAAGFASLVLANPVQAAPTLIGSFSGNECGGAGGFSNCYAFQNGTTAQGAGNGTGSPSIYKRNSDGSTDTSSRFPSISGGEFAITYTTAGNQLSFTYTPGANDPLIHYFVINQANQSRLYYDAAPITSFSVGLSNLFPNNPGYSHITFFDTGTAAVPEPGAWAMMMLGFGAMGFAMRRKKVSTRIRFA